MSSDKECHMTGLTTVVTINSLLRMKDETLFCLLQDNRQPDLYSTCVLSGLRLEPELLRIDKPYLMNLIFISRINEENLGLSLVKVLITSIQFGI